VPEPSTQVAPQISFYPIADNSRDRVEVAIAIDRAQQLVEQRWELKGLAVSPPYQGLRLSESRAFEFADQFDARAESAPLRALESPGHQTSEQSMSSLITKPHDRCE
jgi:hypothetical protein